MREMRGETTYSGKIKKIYVKKLADWLAGWLSGEQTDRQTDRRPDGLHAKQKTGG